jgi:hypothetical protein
MSRFQMFASPLLGWYRCRSAASDPGRLRRTLGAPVRLRQTAPVRRCRLSADPRSATTHESRQSHCCARGHAFGASG